MNCIVLSLVALFVASSMAYTLDTEAKDKASDEFIQGEEHEAF